MLEAGTGAEKGELIQASEAFEQVEKLGRADDSLNLARVYFKEGRLDEAVAALNRAAGFDPPAPRWTLAWFSGVVNKQNGHLDEAISQFRSILEDRYPELDRRGLDFSKDYEVLNELGQAYFERRNSSWPTRSASRSFCASPLRRCRRHWRWIPRTSPRIIPWHWCTPNSGGSVRPRIIGKSTRSISLITTRRIAPSASPGGQTPPRTTRLKPPSFILCAAWTNLKENRPENLSGSQLIQVRGIVLS